MERKSLQNIEQLTGLIAVLENQEKEKRDYVASSSLLSFVNGQLIVMQGDTPIVYIPTPYFHSQVAEKLGIPKPYYDRMIQNAKNLLDTNVNHWLTSDASKNFLVRTFENAEKEMNTARALLSDRYSIIDNYQVLVETLEAIKKTGINIEVINAELSDTRMYLKVVAPEVEVKATELLKNYALAKERGDGVISGFTVQNSEIGAGAFMISPRAVILACRNGMITKSDAMKSIHLGARMDELGFNKNQRVMKANLQLIKEQVQHAVKMFLSKEYLTKTVNIYSKLGEPKIEAPIDKVIEVVGKTYQISEDRKANILKYFVEGGDTRRIGLASAMTFECQGLADADQKHETEVASYEMLNNFEKIEAAAMKIKRSSN